MTDMECPKCGSTLRWWQDPGFNMPHYRTCDKCFYNDFPHYDCLKCGPTTHPVDPDGVCINCYKKANK